MAKKKVSEQIEGTIDNWRDKYGSLLKTFLAEFIELGLETTLDTLEKKAIPLTEQFIKTMEESGELPEEMKPILEELKKPTGAVAGLLAGALGYSVVGGAVSKILDALFLRMGYWSMARSHPVLPAPEQALAYWLRHPEGEEDLNTILRYHGADDITMTVLKELVDARLDIASVQRLWVRNRELYEPLWKDIADQGVSESRIALLKELAEFRLPPEAVSRLWLRDKAKYEKWWKDLIDQGWDKDRIDIAKELSHIVPPVADMVRFADYGGFDPKIIEEWKDMYDAPDWIAKPMGLAGISNEAPWEWANRYWFSHWTQPGRFELVEMYRRGILADKTYPSGEPLTAKEREESKRIMEITYLTQGFSKYWQPKLTELVKQVPTRVDVRRFWDMGTISENRLREIYQAQGYFDQDLEDYVLWTKVYVAFPDLVARYKNGWITLEEVKSELKNAGLEEPRLSELLETKFQKVAAERTTNERDLTKTDIYRGVKKEVITWAEGLELLQDLGYDKAEAEFILEINIAAAAGSPETYGEFKRMTQLYRQSQGLKADIPPTEIIEAEKALKQAEIALREAESQKWAVEKLAPYLSTKSDAEYRYRQLLIAWEQEKKKSP